jgi:hypothetical protein
MDNIPNSAIVTGIGLLIAIWGFLAHMIISQGPDAHLQFLVELMTDVDEQSGSSNPRGPSPGMPIVDGAIAPHEAARNAANETQSYSLQQIRREVPLLFATSIRGRGM